MSEEPFSAIAAAIGSSIASAASAAGSAIGSGLAAIGGGSAVAGATTVAGTAAGLASAGTSIARATQKAPGAKIIAPPSPVEAQAAKAVERKRAARGLRFQDTFLSDAVTQQLGKTKLGQ
jgi:hypothetical protein